MIRRLEVRGLAIALGAVAATVFAYWLPIFQVGGFVYTMIDSFGGRGQFVAAIALPIALGVVGLVALRRSRSGAAVVVVAAAVMVALTPIDHLTEAAWQREHPELLGAPFEFRYGFAIAFVGTVLGAIAFIVLVGDLLSTSATERDGRLDACATFAVIGLLAAIAGQLAESSAAHLWQLPKWPQVGRWWKLVVTAAIVGLAVWRRGPAALATGALVAIVAAAGAAQEINAVAGLDDDPAVSTTVTLVGFTLVAVALITALVGSLRRR